MTEDSNLIQNKNFNQTYEHEGNILLNIDPNLVVSQFPLVHGDYQRLISSDVYETWKNNSLAAFITALINFVAKLVVHTYLPNEKSSKPELWELSLLGITFLAYIICVLLNKFCTSPKKDLKRRIEEKLGK